MEICNYGIKRNYIKSFGSVLNFELEILIKDDTTMVETSKKKVDPRCLSSVWLSSPKP